MEAVTDESVDDGGRSAAFAVVCDREGVRDRQQPEMHRWTWGTTDASAKVGEQVARSHCARSQIGPGRELSRDSFQLARHASTQGWGTEDSAGKSDLARASALLSAMMTAVECSNIGCYCATSSRLVRVNNSAAPAKAMHTPPRRTDRVRSHGWSAGADHKCFCQNRYTCETTSQAYSSIPSEIGKCTMPRPPGSPLGHMSVRCNAAGWYIACSGRCAW